MTHFNHATHTARCGRVLPKPIKTLEIEPDASGIDHIIGWLCAMVIVVMFALLVIEKVTS